MLDFYKTGGGRKFFDGTIPRLIDVLERVAVALEENNNLRKKEIAFEAVEAANPEIDDEEAGRLVKVASYVLGDLLADGKTDLVAIRFPPLFFKALTEKDDGLQED